MHLYDTIKGDNAREYCKTFLKLNPEKYDLTAVNRIEVFGTDIDDPGEDYCEYRVIDSNEKVMAIKRERGY